MFWEISFHSRPRVCLQLCAAWGGGSVAGSPQFTIPLLLAAQCETNVCVRADCGPEVSSLQPVALLQHRTKPNIFQTKVQLRPAVHFLVVFIYTATLHSSPWLNFCTDPNLLKFLGGCIKIRKQEEWDMFIVRYGTGVRGDLWCASQDSPASNTRDCAAARQCAHDMKSSVSKVITVILTSRTNYHPVAIPHKYWTSILLELPNYKEYSKISTSFLQLQLFKRISEPIVMQICDFLSKFDV